MKQWEFLLQKDGDRSWLPLDSPNVEILEGRYRVVVRSTLLNTPVEVRISHLAADADPPKRRVQKRSGRTNHQGLMVLIPFTSLQAGIWELQCFISDLMADLVNPGNQQAVQLQVLPQESEQVEWEADWTEPLQPTALPLDAPPSPIAPLVAAMFNLESAPSPDIDQIQPESASPDCAASDAVSGSESIGEATSEAPAELSEKPTAMEPRSPQTAAGEAPEACESNGQLPWLQLTEELSEQLMNDVLGDFDLTQSENQPGRETVRETVRETEIALSPNLTAAGAGFALRLDRDAFVGSNGEALTLSGWVETTTPEAAVEEFQLCLRDPQTQQVLVNDRHSLVGQTYGFPFFLSVTLPAQVETRLIQGELRLWGIPFGADLAIVLANQAFTITVNPSELVRELDQVHASLAQHSADGLLSGLRQPETLKLELSFLERESSVAEVARSRSCTTPPTAGAIPVVSTELMSESATRPSLPPQLQSASPSQAIRKAASKTLNLPRFGGSPEQVLEPPMPSVSPDTAIDQAAPTSSAIFLERDPEPITDSELALVAELPTAPGLLVTPVAADTAPSDTSIVPPCPAHSAFRSLNLQARFLDRLSMLATDAELPALLRRQAISTRDRRPEQRQLTPPLAAAAAHLSQEIVIQDDPIESQPLRRRSKHLAGDVNASPDRTLALPEEVPIPIPDLQVTSGELVSGQPVNIRVRLPDVASRIYVKLWINDRQTRTLMDGPRWLVDFLPNGHGDLEALTQLTVPYGSLEIRFEAIAVEMHTQRESRKAAVDRSVVPPDLPFSALSESLYEFEGV
jgi:hypothetical protein